MLPAVKGIHIEPTNICTLKCPGCARTGFIDQWPQHWKNHSIDPDLLLNFLDIDLTGVEIKLCGNYGDPIYHYALSDLVGQFKQKKAKIILVTNGSYKTVAWWRDLAKQMDTDDEIIFSIDGLPNNFQQYRINADWESIHRAIKICVESGLQTVWKFIPFSYNQTDVEAAAELSRQLGMADFRIDLSDRFNGVTERYRPAAHLISSEKILKDDFKKGRRFEVDPKCMHGHQHFVSAEGYYSPCCFVADHRFYYKTQFGQNKKEYDISKSTLSDLLGRASVVDFYQNIKSAAPMVCQFSCARSS